ncbi:AraC family transcriptional regulator [Aliikangiella coralliicola]|uniref:AraC family transcriptional regulator n=1 Tax=Aliikangiella coralliicola TaxID=2592383 RepID=A0A545UE86_9GAMM|nr:AraC family transcriptional regulator [Aliikangiella coralliicola]TQV87781.1 AraC family transcriptional regulator [Aliikangiella coralliicola]
MQRFFKSIDFIEQHLYDKISVHEIAAASHYSTYHFSRIFKALVGDTPKEYLRKRRLTVAAKRLLSENIGILDLALDCQFDSQEAFTRAFKTLFNITPAQYRKQNDPFRLLYKDQFSPNMLRFLQDELSMEPEIISRPALKLVGIAKQYDNANLSLPMLWSAFRPYKDKIKNRIGDDSFGIYESYEEEGDEVKFSYVCTASVSNFDHIPEGMTARELPQQMYAKFTHRGSITNLEQTLKYIWGSWLPKSNYDYIEKPDFELYPSGYNVADPKSEMYLHIPIQAK